MMVAGSTPLTNDWPCSGIGEQHVAPGVRGGETQRLGEYYQVVGCRETGWLGSLQGEEPRTWGSLTYGQQLSRYHELQMALPVPAATRPYVDNPSP
jgi:hypothetical protein